MPMPMAVTLKKPTLSDMSEFLRAVEQSRELHRGLVSPPDDADTFRECIQGLRKRNKAAFLVLTLSQKDLAGVVNVSEIVRGCFQSAYLGFYAFEPFAGRGLMRQGVQQVLRYCFDELGLHRIEANIQPANVRSIAMVRRLGFRLEGLSKRYLKICGHWRDHERWALLCDEWQAADAALQNETRSRQ